MHIKAITALDEEWNLVKEYAEGCSWRAGKALAQMMDNHGLTDWERVIAAFDDGRVCGFCTAAKTDCILEVPYSPYIGYVFVGEDYRGARLSEKMILYTMEYLRSIGFTQAYLVSDHENLYEKYGFHVIDRKIAPWGAEEKIYMQKLS